MENYYEGLSISESEYPLERTGKGRIAVFIYTGPLEPSEVLDNAVRTYVDTNGYHEWVDANMDNPWVRAITSEVNGIHQEPFDPDFHRIDRNLNR